MSIEFTAGFELSCQSEIASTGKLVSVDAGLGLDLSADVQTSRIIDLNVGLKFDASTIMHAAKLVDISSVFELTARAGIIKELQVDIDVPAQFDCQAELNLFHLMGVDVDCGFIIDCQSMAMINKILTVDANIEVGLDSVISGSYITCGVPTFEENKRWS
jgi:hypothetical protein